MALLTITLDTDEQTMTVNVDGEEIPNVCDVSICKYGYDEETYSFGVTTSEKVGKVSRMMRLTAAKDPSLKEIPENRIEPARAGLVNILPVPALQSSIASYLKSNRTR